MPMKDTIARDRIQTLELSTKLYWSELYELRGKFKALCQHLGISISCAESRWEVRPGDDSGIHPAPRNETGVLVQGPIQILRLADLVPGRVLIVNVHGPVNSEVVALWAEQLRVACGSPITVVVGPGENQVSILRQTD